MDLWNFCVQNAVWQSNLKYQYKMKKISILFLLILVCSTFASAQKIQGKVYFLTTTGEKEAGAFANVWWAEGKNAVETDENGEFTLKQIKGDNITLIAAYVGYAPDTVKVFENGVNLLPDKEIIFNLSPANELESVYVTGRQEANFLSKTANIKTEVISAAGLCKMACCSLAESFESSASVSVGYSDAVTGAKQIKLLGLSGSYTQMLDETRPIMRGLASPFGLTYIPGQWLESIQIAKGPSSVVNGLEAITGQINVEHRKPTAENPLFVNLFFNSNLRAEANLASSLQLNDKWSTVMMGHFSKDSKIHDANEDGFRDDPLTQQVNFDNRWLYFNPNGTQVRFGFKLLNDTRVGGHVDYEEGMNDRYDPIPGKAFSNGIWGNEIHNKGVSGFFKLGIPLNEDQSRNIAVVADYSYYDMESSYGLKDFGAHQNMGFFNAMYQHTPNENHKYTLGISGRMDDIQSVYSDFSGYSSNVPSGGVENKVFNTDDKVIGAYGEYTYTFDEKVSFVAGLRADYSSQWGWQVAPRASLKYSFTDQTVVRFTGGRGFRTPHVIVDNLGVLSSGRSLKVADNIQAEDAWTFGGNFTQYFRIGDRESNYFSFDYFRSGFNHKVVYDWDSGLANGVVDIYDFNDATAGNNRAFTDTYQVDLSVEPIERFTAIATFRYSNAKISMKNKGLVEAPMTSRYKAVLNLQYAMPMNKWMFDVTAQLNGPCRLPDFMGGGESDIYPMMFAQITKKFSMVDVYAGVENITNYTQKNPIIGAAAPFDRNFNAAMVWGPLMGRMFYIGMRYTMWK